MSAHAFGAPSQLRRACWVPGRVLTVQDPKDLTTLVAKITAAYLSRHQVEPSLVPDLIQQIRASLASTPAHAEAPPASGTPLAQTSQNPAVPISESVTPDYLICLEDGKRLKMLKRHLRSSFGLSPKEYRTKWGLPDDYPMVAPNYATKRSGIARDHRFGSSNAKPKRPQAHNAELALTAMRSIGDAVVCTDVQCAITFMNAVAERLTGWDALQAEGKCFIEVFKLQERASRTQLYPARLCIDQARPFVVEVGTVLLSKSGEELDVGFSAAPIRTRAGEIVGSVLIFNNLTRDLPGGPG